LSKAKYEYAKIQQETLLEDASAMIFIILVCYIAHTAKYLTYMLKSADVTQIW